MGRILGNGAKFTGQAFGIRRVPAIKGQAMPAYDPRGLKGNGVLYATSTMGADHTAGNAFETLRTTNPLAKENQVFNSRQLQIRAALLDTMGVCIFIRPAFVKRSKSVGAIVQGKVRLGYLLPGDPKTGRPDPGNGKGIQLPGRAHPNIIIASRNSCVTSRCLPIIRFSIFHRKNWKGSGIYRSRMIFSNFIS